jgi:glycosyltransferase involved in cell wall biosynthesis
MENNHNLVSIGMPIYNEERYLSQTLDSLLLQDYSNFELIISDNASDDATRDICIEYAARDKRIRYYRNDKNLGSIKNFNRVFELCNGEYFMWASGHDIWYPSYISRCLEVLSRDSSVVSCHPQAVWIDGQGNLLQWGEDLGKPQKIIPSSLETRGLSQISRFNIVLWKLGYGYPIHGLTRSSVLRKTQMFRSIPAPDTILLLEMSVIGCFARLEEPLFCFRKLPDYSSWDIYIRKCFEEQMSATTIQILILKMIRAYFEVGSTLYGYLPRFIAFLSISACLVIKYWKMILMLTMLSIKKIRVKI